MMPPMSACTPRLAPRLLRRYATQLLPPRRGRSLLAATRLQPALPRSAAQVAVEHADECDDRGGPGPAAACAEQVHAPLPHFLQLTPTLTLRPALPRSCNPPCHALPRRSPSSTHASAMTGAVPGPPRRLSTCTRHAHFSASLFTATYLPTTHFATRLATELHAQARRSSLCRRVR